MRRSHDAVAESASSRLAELAARLERAGVPRAEPDDLANPVEPAGLVGLARPVGPVRPPVVAEEELVEPAVLAEPGRHLRGRLPAIQPGAQSGARSRLAEWLLDRTPPWLQGRVSLGGGHVAVLAMTAVVSIAVTAWLLHRPATPVERVAEVAEITASPSAAAALVTPAPTASATGPDAGSASGSPSGSPASSGVVVVDVAGKVRRPGVLTLPAGSRVTDAITRAGGPRAGVSLTSLNLARVLVDGEQILVGVAPVGGVAAPAAGGSGAAGSGAAGSDGPLVNLNTATLTELDGLPGVGPVTAQKILDWRDSHGAFSAVDELLEIDGIGEKTLAQLASRVTL